MPLELSLCSGDDGTVWGVDRSGLIYRRDGNAWISIPGQLAMISVGNSSNVWGASRDGSIYRWNGSGWVQVPGTLHTLSVASDGTVWGMMRLLPLPATAVQIYRLDGSSWTLVDGSLMQISVGSRSLIWGVDANGKVYNRSGPTSSVSSSTSAAHVPIHVGRRRFAAHVGA